MPDWAPPAPRPDLDLARQIVTSGRTLLRGGLNAGSSGNISARCTGDDTILITPSGRDWRLLRERDLVAMDLGPGAWIGGRPSSVVHHHGPWASMVAAARRTIPVLIDEAAEIGPIPTAPYAPSGSSQLAEAAVGELGPARNAVLLANHGVVAVGRSLAEALRRALEVERLAKIFVGAQALGGAEPLRESEIAANRAFFEAYHDAGDETLRTPESSSEVSGPVRLCDLISFGFHAGVTMATLLWSLVHQRLRAR
jgi:L-fuculose-phosphate aldolase